MRHVEVTHKQDNLNQEVWKFLYSDSRHSLTLVDYSKQERPTPRHKFKSLEWWDAYSDRRHRYDGKRIDNPPLPDDVKTEAVEMFMNSLKVTKGFERND